MGMKDELHYDGNLEMFCETPRAINISHVRFLRCLIEQGRLEHPPAGPPSGELAPMPAARPLRKAG